MEASVASSTALIDGLWRGAGPGGLDSIKLIPKIRPSTTPNLPDCVMCVGHKELMLLTKDRTQVTWRFDFVASPHMRQSSFFKVAGRPMADHFLQFYNAAVLAYGQTGSGKTHTMLGSVGKVASSVGSGGVCGAVDAGAGLAAMHREAGLIPRILHYVFAKVAAEGLQHAEVCDFTLQQPTAPAPSPAQPPHRLSQLPPTPSSPIYTTPLAERQRSRLRSGIPTPIGPPCTPVGKRTPPPGVTPPPSRLLGTATTGLVPGKVMSRRPGAGPSPRPAGAPSSPGGTQYLIKVSMLQIYQEVVTDLLSDRPDRLQLRESLQDGVTVVGLSETVVHSAAEALTLLRQGAAQRAVAETASNPVSSRSHCILTLHLEAKDILDGGGGVRIRRSRMQLVDLAGSERTVKGADIVSARQKEANAINKSLSTLSLVISRLLDTSRSQGPVPYRDSKLTFLLQDCLGGNAKTLIIANLNPSPSCHPESSMTLGFALRAMRVRNRAVVNEDRHGASEALQGECRRLREELSLFRALQAEDGAPQSVEQLSAWRNQTAARATELRRALELHCELEEQLGAARAETERLHADQAALEEQCDAQRREMSALEATVEQCEDELLELRARPTVEQYQAVVQERDDARLQRSSVAAQLAEVQAQALQLQQSLQQLQCRQAETSEWLAGRREDDGSTFQDQDQAAVDGNGEGESYAEEGEEGPQLAAALRQQVAELVRKRQHQAARQAALEAAHAALEAEYSCLLQHLRGAASAAAAGGGGNAVSTDEGSPRDQNPQPLLRRCGGLAPVAEGAEEDVADGSSAVGAIAIGEMRSLPDLMSPGGCSALSSPGRDNAFAAGAYSARKDSVWPEQGNADDSDTASPQASLDEGSGGAHRFASCMYPTGSSAEPDGYLDQLAHGSSASSLLHRQSQSRSHLTPEVMPVGAASSLRRTSASHGGGSRNPSRGGMVAALVANTPAVSGGGGYSCSHGSAVRTNPLFFDDDGADGSGRYDGMRFGNNVDDGGPVVGPWARRPTRSSVGGPAGSDSWACELPLPPPPSGMAGTPSLLTSMWQRGGNMLTPVWDAEHGRQGEGREQHDSGRASGSDSRDEQEAASRFGCDHDGGNAMALCEIKMNANGACGAQAGRQEGAHTDEAKPARQGAAGVNLVAPSAPRNWEETPCSRPLAALRASLRASLRQEDFAAAAEGAGEGQNGQGNLAACALRQRRAVLSGSQDLTPCSRPVLGTGAVHAATAGAAVDQPPGGAVHSSPARGSAMGNSGPWMNGRACSLLRSSSTWDRPEEERDENAAPGDWNERASGGTFGFGSPAMTRRSGPLSVSVATSPVPMSGVRSARATPRRAGVSAAGGGKGDAAYSPTTRAAAGSMHVPTSPAAIGSFPAGLAALSGGIGQCSAHSSPVTLTGLRAEAGRLRREGVLLADNVEQLEDELARRLQGEVQLRRELQDAVADAQHVGAQCEALLELNSTLADDLGQRDERLRGFEELLARLYGEMKAIARQQGLEATEPGAATPAGPPQRLQRPPRSGTAFGPDPASSSPAAWFFVTPGRPMDAASQPLATAAAPDASASPSLSDFASSPARASVRRPTVGRLARGSVAAKGLVELLAQLRDSLRERDQQSATMCGVGDDSPHAKTGERVREATGSPVATEKPGCYLGLLSPVRSVSRTSSSTDNDAARHDSSSSESDAAASKTNVADGNTEAAVADAAVLESSGLERAAALQTALAEREAQLAGLENSLAEWAAALGGRDERIVELQAAVAGAEAELQRQQELAARAVGEAALIKGRALVEAAGLRQQAAETLEAAERAALGEAAKAAEVETLQSDLAAAGQQLATERAQVEAAQREAEQMRHALLETATLRQQAVEAVSALRCVQNGEEKLKERHRLLEMQYLRRGNELHDLRRELDAARAQLAEQSATPLPEPALVAALRQDLAAAAQALAGMRAQAMAAQVEAAAARQAEETMRLLLQNAQEVVAAAAAATGSSAGDGQQGLSWAEAPALQPQHQYWHAGRPLGAFGAASSDDGSDMRGGKAESNGGSAASRPGRAGAQAQPGSSRRTAATSSRKGGQPGGSYASRYAAAQSPGAGPSDQALGGNKGTWVQRFLHRRGATIPPSAGGSILNGAGGTYAPGGQGQGPVRQMVILTPARRRPTRGVTGIVLRSCWVPASAAKGQRRVG